MKQNRLSGGLALVAAAVACAGVYHIGTAPHAEAADNSAAEKLAAEPVFVGTGTDDNANFQAALDDVLGQADQFFAQFGADLRYNYEVLETTGERGGFVFFNNIFVKIRAWL